MTKDFYQCRIQEWSCWYRSIVSKPLDSFKFKIFNVHSLAFSVRSPASRVQSPAFKVQSAASRVQSPASSVQSPAFRVQRPESSVQSPAFNSCVQIYHTFFTFEYLNTCHIVTMSVVWVNISNCYLLKDFICQKLNWWKWLARFFSKNWGKFTVVIDNRMLHCKEVIKEFSLFLKVHDEFAIEVECKVSFHYL